MLRKYNFIFHFKDTKVFIIILFCNPIWYVQNQSGLKKKSQCLLSHSPWLFHIVSVQCDSLTAPREYIIYMLFVTLL